MSSSFFLSNTSSGSKIKASGIKRKYEGQNRGKPKTPKKFSAGGKKKAQDKNKFSKGKFLVKYYLQGHQLLNNIKRCHISFFNYNALYYFNKDIEMRRY